MIATKIPDGCIVRLIDLPPSVGGLVSEDETGFLNIYINARWGKAMQIRSLRHEIDHIEKEDLHNNKTIQEVEGLT